MGTSPSSDERQLAARILSRAGVAGNRARFEREVDPEHTLPPDELERRVQAAQTAYFRNLGRRGAAARWGSRAGVA